MRLRCFFLLAALSAVSLCHAARGEDNSDWTRTLHKAAGMDSYTFRIEEKPGAGTGGVVEGKYQKGRPVSFQADSIDFYRKGPVLVYKEGDRWQRSKTGIESDPLRILGAAAKVRGARLPHEELADLEEHLKDVRKAEGEEKATTVYRAALDPEAVKNLVPSAYRAVAQSGTARLWVNAAGRLTRYEVTIKVQGRLGNAEVDGSTTRVVSLSDVGSTRVDVPEAATKALE